MSDANGTSPRKYRVVLTGMARQQFLTLIRRSRATGRASAFISALQEVEKQLETHPHDFGEPLYRLRHMKLLVFLAVLPPLTLEYGVHEVEPAVIVRSVSQLTDPDD